MFGKKKKTEETDMKFDSAKQKAVLRCSICTGEQVAGFKDNITGNFEEIMLIRNAADLEQFMRQYGITEIKKEY